MSRITCDRSGWPIVVFKFPESYSNEEFDEYLGDLSVVVALRPTALIIDASSASLPSVVQRHRLMRLAKADWQLLSNLRAVVFIVDSLVARCALTAISWIVAKPCPIELVANMRQAQAVASSGGIGAPIMIVSRARIAPVFARWQLRKAPRTRTQLSGRAHPQPLS